MSIDNKKYTKEELDKIFPPLSEEDVKRNLDSLTRTVYVPLPEPPK